jgi:hypothetical protein
MDKFRKPSNSVCYTPSSQPYRIYFIKQFSKMNLFGVVDIKQQFGDICYLHLHDEEI